MTAARIGWLELNAQRAAAAVGFYRDLMGWQIRALHVAPWGMLPVFVAGGRPFGLAFNAMGAFAPARWLPSITGDPARALALAGRLGGAVEGDGGVEEIPGHGRTATLRDPLGALFKVVALEAPLPEGGSAPGSVLGAGLWAREADAAVRFYAELLECAPGPVREGITPLGPALCIHDVAYEVVPARWVPAFHSVSPGGDGRRAEILGAVCQVPVGDRPGLGRLGVWNDPAGSAFALLRPDAPGD